MARVETRGASKGDCNICGEYGKLTEDHTPPQGSVKITQMELRHLVEHLAVDPPKEKGRLSQNGVKYRTLCSDCNNRLLGQHYDPDFNSFVNQVSRMVNSCINLPKVVYIKAKPQKIVKAVIGHLMAQRVNGFKKGEKTEALKDWFADVDSTMPDYFRIYYWVYPYRRHVLVRDAVMTHLDLGEPASFWLMKFYPIAFLVIWDDPEGYRFNLRSFDRYRLLSPDDEVEIPLDLSNIPHQYWPEAPDDNRILTYGSGAIGALEKPAKRKAKKG